MSKNLLLPEFKTNIIIKASVNFPRNHKINLIKMIIIQNLINI